MTVQKTFTHESNDWSEYDNTPGSELTISASAALNGTSYGIEYAPAGVTNGAQYDASSWAGSATSTISMGAYINKNTLALASNGDFAEIFNWSHDSLSGSYLAFENVSSVFKLVAYGYDDADTEYSTSYTFPTGTHTIEWTMTRASSDVASDGKFELFVDGSSVGSVTSLDNYDYFEGLTTFEVGTGNLNGSGVCYIDEIKLGNDEVLFPANFSGYDLVRGSGQL